MSVLGDGVLTSISKAVNLIHSTTYIRHIPGDSGIQPKSQDLRGQREVDPEFDVSLVYKYGNQDHTQSCVSNK